MQISWMFWKKKDIDWDGVDTEHVFSWMDAIGIYWLVLDSRFKENARVVNSDAADIFTTTSTLWVSQISSMFRYDETPGYSTWS